MAFGDDAPEQHYDLRDCGVIMGTGWAGQDETQLYYDDYQRTGMGSPFRLFFSMPNASTAAVSLLWGLRGYQNTPVAACATGTIAIGDAFELIRNGRANMSLAGAGESRVLTARCGISTYWERWPANRKISPAPAVRLACIVMASC